MPTGTINVALSLVTEWHCYQFIFILYSVFDVVMVFNQLFLVYETMVIQCMYMYCPVADPGEGPGGPGPPFGETEKNHQDNLKG